jgi:hypothetical protein
MGASRCWRFRLQEIGPHSASAIDGLLSAPFGDFGVVAAEENFGDGHALELGGLGVVRGFE